jgi:general stress protein 26
MFVVDFIVVKMNVPERQNKKRRGLNMEDIIKDAVHFIGEIKTALLTTIIDGNYIDSRLIGPFVNEELTVYIFTLNSSNKIEQINKNSHVSLYVQNNFENTKEYKSLLINGKAGIVVSIDKIIKMQDALEIKASGYKAWIDKNGWDKWSIIKIQPEYIKFVDNSKWREPKLITIDNK